MIEGFAQQVLAWGLPQLRDLPWRTTRDPWAILVSEVMAQQTQVERVIPAWHAFLAAYPMPLACARAPLADVLRLWQGLGYPRRARNLHRAAGQIGSGPVPDSLDELLDLPGIGPYTARAVLAFAFERDVAVVDTNIARVYARIGGERLSARQAQATADRYLPAGRSWEWNQCLMDLGARLCRARSPRCVECPVADRCTWNLDGGDDPAHGSAGVSGRQSRFEGSDRQARGRLLAAAADGPVADTALVEVMGRDHAIAQRLVADLVAEGLVEFHDGAYRLSIRMIEFSLGVSVRSRAG
ncbi:MAG: A/G-specific adenine glycosylase [Ilumatobacter coccineus]|uniref:Adenine DNA glycosylase n=1 Tax=Ilumatobacter coccineus TaxID=467094 RepID=A0A2G6K7D7_9ACTN|nr:MAG: A/G-specific adenine glycosylase [Ilumatobacter coccineus]